MKLLTRTTLYFIPVTFLVLGLGGWVFYHTLSHYTQEDATERLQGEKNAVINYATAHKALPPTSIAFGDTVAFTVVPALFSLEKLKDTTLYNAFEKEYEPYRRIMFPLSIDGTYYSVSIFKPLIESDDLTKAIWESLAIIGFILLFVLTVFNILIAKTTWKPFYISLEKLKSFDLSKNNQIAFDKTTTREFMELNDALSVMTVKISSDYRNLKEFTENASHELQTPLAIIQSKLELLIQSENLSPEQANNVKAIYESANKLSRLNQALLLLTKIENRQFAETKEIELGQLINNKLELFSELIEHKKLSLERNISPLHIKIHPMLADILVTNLIGNAIKHNLEGGKLRVELIDGQMIITNSGNELKIAAEDLFGRFKKVSSQPDSLGLGLAIVKEICNAYNFTIQYQYTQKTHRVLIGF